MNIVSALPSYEAESCADDFGIVTANLGSRLAFLTETKTKETAQKEE